MSEATEIVQAHTQKILIDGEELSRREDVSSIVINKEVNRIAFATVTISSSDWGEGGREPLSISNQDVLLPGKIIEIKGGTTDDETLFKGIIIKHSLKIRENAPPMIIIECKDAAVKMTTNVHSKYFADTKDSDIMVELMDTHGIENDVEDTSITYKEMVQYNTTDWDFMLCRCDANGMIVIPEDGKITIKKPNLSEDSAATLKPGTSLVDLDAEIDSRNQYKSIKATSWNPADQELVESEGEEANVPDGGNISFEDLADVSGEDELNMKHSGNLDSTELQQWADAKMLKQRLAKIRGKAKLTGITLITPGSFVTLEDVGERFNGKVFVTGVRYQLDSVFGWRTFIQFGLNPEWFKETFAVEQPLAGGLLPGVEGLQVGIVTQLQDDPNGEHRIKVRVPVIHAEDEGIWSRVCTLDAGENRGTFFRPEIDDEVIVAFINNDPRHAVVLGMMNSSAKPAPLTASNDNHEKGYVSRSGMKMIFDDDKNSIKMETPSGNKVSISEDDKGIKLKDENGNKIILDDNGITGESASDMKWSIMSGKIEIMDAAGNQVKIEASGVTVQSASKLTLSAPQIELSSATLSVSAAMAQFSGVVQCTTLIATSVVGTSYTPGAGNIF